MQDGGALGHIHFFFFFTATKPKRELFWVGAYVFNTPCHTCSRGCGIKSTVGLASATSQLDRNAWQRVATYKSGSNKLGVVSFLYGTTSSKQGRIEHQPSFHFAEQLQPGFSCLVSSGSDSVLYSKFLFYVSCSPSHIAQCSTSPALLPWRRPVEAATISFPWAVLCVVDSLSLILVGHSKGKTHETIKRRQVHHTSSRMISMQPCSWTNIRARRSTSARSETAPHSTQIFPNPIICSIMSQ